MLLGLQPLAGPALGRPPGRVAQSSLRGGGSGRGGLGSCRLGRLPHAPVVPAVGDGPGGGAAGLEVARANLHEQQAVLALNLCGIDVAVSLVDLDLQSGWGGSEEAG